MKMINVANDFSVLPAGRYVTDGDYTGEHFYRFLVKNLEELPPNEVIEINFDGVLGAGSSFLEQSFAELVRQGNISKSDFKKRFKIIANDHPEIISKVQRYVEGA